jgi:hypothetical protein
LQRSGPIDESPLKQAQFAVLRNTIASKPQKETHDFRQPLADLPVLTNACAMYH